tara:strand:+ start:39224 stop:39373 length:150 start_codon:yes stop_codon:yes gene_type:complete
MVGLTWHIKHTLKDWYQRVNIRLAVGGLRPTAAPLSAKKTNKKKDRKNV